MRKSCVVVFCLLGLWAATGVLCHAAERVLVENGASRYSIHFAPAAPTSVCEAAQELQRVIRISTGVTLPIVTNAVSPMLCLGDGPAADRAGIAPDPLAPEGFVIRTRGADVFIVGNDTPEGDEPWEGHISRGTFFGACAFLEQVLGVRWLLPGEWGEDIPRHAVVQFGALDVRQAPAFPFRTLNYVQGRYDDVVKLWKRRNRVHEWYRVAFPHSYDDHPSREVLKKHPEYMAMRNDGTRIPVPDVDHTNPKYCLTDPGLVQAFADSIIAHFDKHPRRWHATMSPSDGARFCECPRCKALVLHEDGGTWGDFAERGWSMTPTVLQFYNQVGRTVRAKYPDRIVGGLLYHAYTYPPDDVIAVEPNVVLNFAVLDHYGYKLYKPERAAELDRLLPAWSHFTKRLAWSDYSTWMRDWYGLPLPPGRSILKRLFPALRDHVTAFVNYVGHAAWGTGALHNYMVARLLWDPGQDVDALYHEFLQRAYGAAAAPFIDRIYQVSARELERYIRDHPGFRKPSYDVSYKLVAEYYAPHFSAFEALYAKAWDAVATEAQRARLVMFGDCLTVLHYNLQCAKLIDDPAASRFYKSHEEYRAFLADHAASRALAAAMKPKEGKAPRLLFARDERRLAIPLLPPDAEAPAIDGDVSDAAWGEAAEATGFQLRGTKLKAGQQTHVRLVFDRERLYLAVTCREDKMGAVKAALRPHDSDALFTDDTFELFIGARQIFKKNYWHVAFNAGGSVYDNVALDRDYDLDFEHVSAKTGDAWTLEMAIPFKSLGVKTTPFGATWHGNFCRIRQAQPYEVSCWSVVEEGFHEPAQFGEWVFAAE